MQKIEIFLIATLLMGAVQGTFAQTKDEIDKKVSELLDKMTLEEKIGQMNQYNGFWDVTGPAPAEGTAALKYEHLRSGMVGSMLNVRKVAEVRKVQKIAVEETRLGIPLIIGFDVIHGYRTQGPIPLAEAASWDLTAIQQASRIAATEASAVGINWTFAPMVDISRDARWGRVMEGAGEDPYLGAQIARARVKGFQGDDLAANNTIAACAKHFAAYGFAEAGKDYNTVDIGMATLYNVALPPFKAAAEAGVRTFMNSFNTLNGVPATGNALLQRDILKKEWGFEGFVVSDWASVAEMVIHGFAASDKEASLKAVLAGSDMDMESYAYIKYLKELVANGQVPESLIDDAVSRILRVKFELGLFDDPYRYCDEKREKELLGAPAHLEAALEMAKKSIVLLKNEKNILPLKKEGLKVTVIGQLAADKTSPLGSWRGDSEDGMAVSVLEGLQVFKGNQLNYQRGVEIFEGTPTFINEVKVNETDPTGIAEAVEAAKGADVVLMVLGEHAFQSGEGRSRTKIDLPGLQQEMLEAVVAVNPKVVLVLMNGRPLDLSWAAENVPAIVETWHLGQQSGHAIAQVLYGDYNPSGKLPMTFPRSLGQVPIYYNHLSTGRPALPSPAMAFWAHYIDEENSPLYPFGYGLSYTTFGYSNQKVSVNGPQEVSVEVTVTNTGKLAGEEVVQLYLHDKAASLARPVKELKGFRKIMLAPGESQVITFKLTSNELGFYNNAGEYLVEPGEFAIGVGGSSAVELSGSFTLP